MNLSRLGSDLAGLARRRSAVIPVEIGFVVAASYISSSLFWILIAGPSAVPPAGYDVHSSGVSGNANIAYDLLAQYDPFHRESLIGALSSADTPPESNLEIKLYGTRLAEGDEGSTAIIRLDNYNHTVLAVGDEVSPGVTLVEIHRAYVVLARGERREILRMDTDPAHAQGGVIEPEQVADAELPSPSRSYFDDVQLNVVRDESGRLSGFVIESVPNSDLEAGTDLRQGDVLVAVNGIPVGNFGPLAELQRTLRDPNGVTLTVERAGTQHTIRVTSP